MPADPTTPLRVAVFGPESTGKTSLAAALANHFGEPWAPEYVRAFWDRHQGVITADHLALIARGQIDGEEAAATRARRVVFCDTELLTCVLWNDLLHAGACPTWVRAEAEVRARRFALYLFCDTDLPFVPDPQRCFPDAAGREMCRRLWRDTLTVRGLRLVTVGGSGPARLAAAVAAVNAILPSAGRVP